MPGMGIHIDVITQLDQRAVEADAAALEATFGEAGAKASEAFNAALAAGGKARVIIKQQFADTAADAAEAGVKSRQAFDIAFARTSGRMQAAAMMREHLQGADKEAENAGEAIGLGFVGKMLSTMKSGLGSGVSSVREGLESGAMLSEAGEAGGAIGATFGVALVAAIELEVAKVTVEVGEKFEEIENQITIHTNRSGESLHELQDAATSLVGNLDTSTKSVGNDMSVLAQRLGASGEEVSKLTEYVEVLRDRWGSLDVNALAGSFAQFNLTVEQSEIALSTLNEQARQQGVDLNTLNNDVSEYSRISQELGLNIEQEIHYFSLLEQNHVNVGRSVMGLQTAEKALAKENDDRRKAGMPEETLPQFIRRAVDAIDDLRAHQQTAKAEELEFLTFGTRNWAESRQGAQFLIDTLSALPGAFNAPVSKLDDFEASTRNIGREWELVKNKIEEAFKPVAADFLKDVTDQLHGFIGYVDEHKDDLKTMFEAVGVVLEQTLGQLQFVITMVVESVHWMGQLAEFVGKVDHAAGDAAIQFARWVQQLPGVQQMESVVEKMSSVIGGIPGAIGGIVTALNNVIPGLKPLIDFLDAAEQKIQAILGQEHVIAGTPVAPPGTHPPRPEDMPGAPGFPTLSQLRSGQVTISGIPPGPYSGMTPDEFEDQRKGGRGRKGPRLPEAPEVPYGPGYGQPEIGETATHFKDRMEVLEKQHELATDQARLDQLQKTSTANEEDIQKVKNKIVQDQLAITEAEAKVNKSETERLKKHSEDLNEIGAKIDKDFGISKGLSGIADNLFKFLANLAAAPLEGMLGVVSQAGGATKGEGLTGLALGAMGITSGKGADAAGAAGAGQPVWTGSGWTTPAARGSTGGSEQMPGRFDITGAMNSPADIMAGGSRVRTLYALANMLTGTPYSVPLRNDCSGMVSKLVTAALGMSPQVAFDTTNEGAFLFSHGFQQGVGPPGSLQVGWRPLPGSAGHTAITLPGGEAAETGLGPGGSFGTGPGGPGRGAFEGGFSQHAWLPMDSGGAVPIIAHSGEHVLTASDVDAMGGQAGVYAFRNALHYDVGGPPEAPPGWPPAPPAPAPPQDVKIAGPLPAAPPGTPPGAATPHLPAGTPATPGPAQPSPVGGLAPWAGDPKGGQAGISQGGLIGGAINAGIQAAMGSGGMSFGAGAAAGVAAQIAMQEINRAIAYGGQLAGIGVQAIGQTFKLSDSQLAQSGWGARIAGGLAGAAPVLANMAGQLGGSGQGTGLPQGVAGLPGASGGLTPEGAAANLTSTGAPGTAQSVHNGNVFHGMTFNYNGPPEGVGPTMDSLGIEDQVKNMGAGDRGFGGS